MTCDAQKRVCRERGMRDQLLSFFSGAHAEPSAASLTLLLPPLRAPACRPLALPLAPPAVSSPSLPPASRRKSPHHTTPSRLTPCGASPAILFPRSRTDDQGMRRLVLVTRDLSSLTRSPKHKNTHPAHKKRNDRCPHLTI